jgi:hypothetical protein
MPLIIGMFMGIGIIVGIAVFMGRLRFVGTLWRGRCVRRSPYAYERDSVRSTPK